MVYHPHVSNFSSSKDTYAILVIGPSLPVIWYLWSFSRPRQPLPGPWHFFCLRKFIANFLPLLTWRRGAEPMFLYHRRRDIWGQPRTPECALIHPTRGREPYQPGCPGKESLDTIPLLHILKASGRAIFRDDFCHVQASAATRRLRRWDRWRPD